ncbi:integrase [Enterobacter mori]|uniref:hypothetical protein n=1 Tax=Enterobacter mori TaxID=539813 RepID=UPI003892C909
MEYAINLGLMDVNPLYRVNRVFRKPEAVNLPAIRPERLPELVRRIETTNLSLLTRYLIKWQLLTLVRPGEASGEMLWILGQLKPLSGDSPFLFPGRGAVIVPCTAKPSTRRCTAWDMAASWCRMVSGRWAARH